jgi:hypothetical protein
MKVKPLVARGPPPAPGPIGQFHQRVKISQISISIQKMRPMVIDTLPYAAAVAFVPRAGCTG